VVGSNFYINENPKSAKEQNQKKKKSGVYLKNIFNKIYYVCSKIYVDVAFKFNQIRLLPRDNPSGQTMTRIGITKSPTRLT